MRPDQAARNSAISGAALVCCPLQYLRDNTLWLISIKSQFVILTLCLAGGSSNDISTLANLIFSCSCIHLFYQEIMPAPAALILHTYG
jgi:hypothetical protein